MGANLALNWRANAFAQGSRPLSRDFHEPQVPRNLVEQRKRSQGFRQDTFAQAVLELQQRVVHAKPVILHAPVEQADQFLLVPQSLADLHKLCRLCVEPVC